MAGAMGEKSGCAGCKAGYLGGEVAEVGQSRPTDVVHEGPRVEVQLGECHGRVADVLAAEGG